MMTLLKKLVAVVLFGAAGVAGVAQPALAQKYVCMESNQGEWCFELLHNVAPVTVGNFVRYVTSGNYANSLVHRVEPGFVIQGGGYGWGTDNSLFYVNDYGSITNEFSRSNLRGTVAMARAAGVVNSASNQWFVNLANNVSLDSVDGGFTVFAEVAYGMDVIDRISNLHAADLSASYPMFSRFPTTAAPGVLINRADAVVITRAYTTELLPGSTLLPYHCTPDVPVAAITEFCSNAVTLPLSIQGAAYEGTLELISSQPMVFALKAGSLKTLATLPAAYANYNVATKELTIPTVRVGEAMYDNVVLKFAGAPSQQFTLTGFTKRL